MTKVWMRKKGEDALKPYGSIPDNDWDFAVDLAKELADEHPENEVRIICTEE